LTPIPLDNLEASTDVLQIITPRLTKTTNSMPRKRFSNDNNEVYITVQSSPEVEIIRNKSMQSRIHDMTKKLDMAYNSNLTANETRNKNPGTTYTHVSPEDVAPSEDDGDATQQKSSTGGKVPHYGPRRLVKPTIVMGNSYENIRTSWRVSSLEYDNYEAICNLASSNFSNETAVDLGGVHCTFWSLGQSLGPQGFVNNFVLATFCRHLFLGPGGHPSASKKHYFFPSVSDNLLKEIEEADEKILMNAFTKSTKAKALQSSNMLFFPTCYQGHWFVFIVDIKDHCFVFLDSHYSSEDEFHSHVREMMVRSFAFHWNKYIKAEMPFDEFEILYPDMPKHGADKMYDSGIYAMMALKYWISPRTLLSAIFQPKDAPRITAKFANDLVFTQTNTGRKDLISSYHMQQE